MTSINITLRDTVSRFINEILRQTNSRDSIHNHYPSRLWFDTVTGEFAHAGDMVIIDTAEWTHEDCGVWEGMTNNERRLYAAGYTAGYTPVSKVAR